MAIHIRSSDGIGLCGQTIAMFDVYYTSTEHLLATVQANHGVKCGGSWANWCNKCHQLAKLEDVKPEPNTES